MKRRKFITRAGGALGSALLAPLILPTGRLFASTGKRRVNHVVLCLFAGGVRNLESIYQREGSLMPNTLGGNLAISRDIAGGMSPLPSPLKVPLQNHGTLFREFRFKKGPTAHISAHLTAISGKYILTGTNAKSRPPFPTVFEYYRKHNPGSRSALDTWLITDRSDPYMLFNYSDDPEYGPEYGGNFIQPKVFLKHGVGPLGNQLEFNSNELLAVDRIHTFMNQNFRKQYTTADAGFFNGDPGSGTLESFIRDSFKESSGGKYDDPWGLGNSMNDDMLNIFFAEKILKHFTPELLVVNMFEVDRGHTDFTLYCNNMRKADYALAHLWNTIQSTPGLADDTVLIAVPEHGRNLKPNTLVDAYGRYALDHTSDPTSRKIFCMLLGPKDVVIQNQVIDKELGESIDVIPTIAKLLGFHSNIPPYMLNGRPLDEALVS